MFRSSAIIRELVLNLAEVIFMLKHSVKLHRYLLRIINNDVISPNVLT
jgi:hypothetical protein